MTASFLISSAFKIVFVIIPDVAGYNYLQLALFFFYIILFNVPVIFILVSHHVTLNESMDKEKVLREINDSELPRDSIT